MVRNKCILKFPCGMTFEEDSSGIALQFNNDKTYREVTEKGCPLYGKNCMKLKEKK